MADIYIYVSRSEFPGSSIYIYTPRYATANNYTYQTYIGSFNNNIKNKNNNKIYSKALCSYKLILCQITKRFIYR